MYKGIVCHAHHDCEDKTVCKCKVGFKCEKLLYGNDNNDYDDDNTGNDYANDHDYYQSDQNFASSH